MRRRHLPPALACGRLRVPGRAIALAVLVSTALAPAAAGAQRSSATTDALQAELRERAAAQPGVTVGVYYRHLGTGESLAWNADTMFHAASTMKVPVMLEYFRALDDGRLGRDQRVTVVNRFASIVDGSPYTLDAGDDSDSALYRLVGREVPVRELVERMITRSSNLATNVVISLVGAPRAQATARALGASTINVRRGVEDNLAFRAGLNNTTSARDLGALFEAIARGQAASPPSTAEMLAILERQEFNDEIPAGLPPGTRVAHKTGWITATLHDAAVVFPPQGDPFVLVVLTRGLPDEKTGQRLIQDIARAVWRHATSAASPH
ncbi:MAG TPA: serine hydrolase [Gemmatimonadaceae bacterium]|nr:serine hydrolase [Gemmatimonadaceae bacterium]